jgi:peptide deformylase
MKLPVIIHPNDAMLRKKTTDVSLEALKHDNTQKLIADMKDTMHAERGIGIAAPQVNASVRICIINKDAFPKRFKLDGAILAEDIALINPYWERTSKKSETDLESCLSIPGWQGNVKRWKRINVVALDIQGNKIEFEAKGYLARVIQHEIDHLEGILYIDRTEDVWEIQ